jgi:hypothetical protein
MPPVFDGSPIGLTESFSFSFSSSLIYRKAGYKDCWRSLFVMVQYSLTVWRGAQALNSGICRAFNSFNAYGCSMYQAF